MTGIKHKRKFDGVTYTLLSSSRGPLLLKTKKQAQTVAETQRNRGLKSRIFEDPTGFAWMVYVRGI